MALGVLQHRAAVVKHFTQVLKRLLAPGGNLRGVEAVARGQLGQRRLPAQRFQRNPGLETSMSGSSASVSWLLLLFIGIIAVTMEQFIHLTKPENLSKKARPPLLTACAVSRTE